MEPRWLPEIMWPCFGEAPLPPAVHLHTQSVAAAGSGLTCLLAAKFPRRSKAPKKRNKIKNLLTGFGGIWLICVAECFEPSGDSPTSGAKPAFGSPLFEWKTLVFLPPSLPRSLPPLPPLLLITLPHRPPSEAVDNLKRKGEGA